jgi:hypothetical protein
MVQATMYEVFPFTSPAPAIAPTPLAERAQTATEALLARSPHRALLGSRQRWIPSATAHLMDWLSDWARTQLTDTGQAITWERCSRRGAASPKGRPAT